MTTTNETQTTQVKQVPDLYIFLNSKDSTKNSKPAGTGFLHKKGNGFTLLLDGKRYAVFPRKPKPAAEPAASEQPAEGEGA